MFSSSWLRKLRKIETPILYFRMFRHQRYGNVHQCTHFRRVSSAFVRYNFVWTFEWEVNLLVHYRYRFLLQLTGKHPSNQATQIKLQVADQNLRLRIRWFFRAITIIICRKLWGIETKLIIYLISDVHISIENGKCFEEFLF